MKIRTLALMALLVPLAACSQEDQAQQPATLIGEAQTTDNDSDAETPLASENAAEDQQLSEDELAAQTEPELRVTQAEEEASSQSQPTQQSLPEPAFQQGVHYRLLTPTQPTSTSPSKVEVVEIFSYGCPHCFSFDPYVKYWLENKPDNTEFVRMAPMFRPEWNVYARAYYTAEVLDVVDDIHSDLFNEIHVNRNFLQTEDAMAKFFADHGVDEQTFRDAYNSYAVNTRLRKATTMAGRYSAHSVPTVVINGKYVSGPELTGGYEGLMQVMNYLVQKELDRN